MKRTEVSLLQEKLPPELRPLIDGARVFDSSSSPEARTYFVDRDGGYYLKVGEVGSLAREATMTEYFHSIGLGVKVCSYISAERDYMLTERALGEDLTHPLYLSEPRKLAVTMAKLLRALHAKSYEGCPVIRTPEYLETVKKNYTEGKFDLSPFGNSATLGNAESAYRFVEKNAGVLRADTLIHGDFCLPNIIFDGWRFSKFIDVGNGGVGDRHIDLFWGAWTLNFNLGTDEYRDVFFDAYGRELIDPLALRVVEAAEIFG